MSAIEARELLLPDELLRDRVLPLLGHLGALQRAAAVCSSFCALARAAPQLADMDLAPLAAVLTDERLGAALASSRPAPGGFVTRLLLPGAAAVSGAALAAHAPRLARVTELDLSGCAALLPEPLGEALAAMPALQQLNLHGCTALLTTASLLALLPRAPFGLQELRLGVGVPNGDAALSADWLRALPRGHELRALSLHRHRYLRDWDVRALLRPGLTSLNLAWCAHLGDEAIDAVARGLPALEQLNVRNLWRLNEPAFLAALPRLPRLRVLNVAGCERLSDEAIAGVAAELPLLEEIHLSRLRVTDAALRSLVGAGGTLRHLYLTLCDGVSDAGVAELVGACGALETLCVSDCAEVTGAFVAAALPGAPLQSLVVRRCAAVDDAALEALLAGGRCATLTKLAVGMCEALTDRALLAVAAGCPRLEVLDVHQCELVGERGVEAVLRGCPRLQRLDVGGLKLLTDDALRAVARHGRALRSLTIKFIPGITPAAVRRMRKACPLLGKVQAEKNSWSFNVGGEVPRRASVDPSGGDPSGDPSGEPSGEGAAGADLE